MIIKNIAMGFTLAMNMLTTLPFFKVHDFFKGINGYAVMFYPLIGFILGVFYMVSHLYLKLISLQHIFMSCSLPYGFF